MKVLATWFLIFALAQAAQKPPPPEAVLAKMTLDEKIGQLFMVGFNGPDVSSELWSKIENGLIGGVILLKPNIQDYDQLKKLTTKLQDGKHPLLIATDQEGGVVNRIKVKGVKEFTGQPLIKSPQHAYKIGKARGTELKNLGINVNFSPVLDSAGRNSFLYNRTFRGNISLKAQQLIRGYQDAGIMATVKHFPGHGDGIIDSHNNLPIVSTKNFRGYIRQFEDTIKKAPPDLVMSAHVLYPKIDKENPASLSPTVIGILRRDLGYDGVIITDDLHMGAITKNFDAGEAALKAFLAGTDLLLYTGQTAAFKEGFDQISAAVKNGTIPEERLNQSLLRILKLKYR